MATEAENIRETLNPAISSQVNAAVSAQLTGILSALARRINIVQVMASQGNIGDIDIDKILLGDAHIGKLTLQGVTARINSASAFLQDVRAVIELRFRLDWWVDILWIEEDGSEDLGSLSFGMSIGDVSVPSLANIDLNVPSMSAENLSTTIAPITGLDLGGGTFNGLDVKDTAVPADGFQLSGLGVGNLSLSNLQVPKTRTREARIQQFKPNAPLNLPRADLTQLQLPAAAAGNIKSGHIALDGIASTRAISVNFGIFGITIKVTPVLHMNIGSMLLQDVSLSAGVSQAKIENIRVPLDVRGVTLKNIDLNGLNVNGVSL